MKIYFYVFFEKLYNSSFYILVFDLFYFQFRIWCEVKF